MYFGFSKVSSDVIYDVILSNEVEEMELPKLGKQCACTNCQQLDFLPVTCDGCSNIFCKDHSSSDKHDCKNIESIILLKKKEVTSSLHCAILGCKETSIVEMLCSKCGQHFCLHHRHHATCFENKDKNKVVRMKENKAQFIKAKTVLDKQVDDKLRAAVKDSKLSTTALKIRLMKIKGKAVGDAHIPSQDRVFFMVYPSLTSSNPARALFVSKDWSIGKCLDMFSKKLKIENNNDKPDSIKLILFNKEDGQILDMSKSVDELIKENSIFNGGSLVLEYQTEKTVNLVNGIPLLTDLEKYT